MMKEKLKNFWDKRAEALSEMSQLENVIFQNDSERAKLYEEGELAVIGRELNITESTVLLDLGAGVGRHTLRFAKKAKHVTAVEFTSEYAKQIEMQAKRENLKNIEVINTPAEMFCRPDYADIVFVSGMFLCLDNEQYDTTANNVVKTLKKGGTLFIRESISLLDEAFIVDRFSEELQMDYCALYRTQKQFIDTFQNYGLKLIVSDKLFDDGSILNRRTETRMYYFVFQKS